jgi:Family of unknown function (DUF6098)
MTNRSELPIVESFDEVVDAVDRLEQVFVRHSAGPASDDGGRSFDYESGVELPGLSVAVLSPEPWWTRPTADWVARRLCKYDELLDADRFPWLLTGDIVGWGPDHEPLVRLREPLMRVGGEALAEARRVYSARFEVGNDSRREGS